MASQTPKPVDLARAYPTMIGSVLSCIGAGFILICYCILPSKRHFRHALIINLAVSDFINSLNNSISGIYIISSRRDMRDGPACVANGFIGQFSVQGTDCSIFIIAVVTLISLTQQKVVIRDTSLIAKCLACGAAWILPIITSFTALSLDLYHPVSGNWCWIQAKPIYLRYVLTHMWRFLGILLSAIIYAYIYLWVHRHFREMKMLGPQSYGANSSYGAASSGVDAERGVKHGHVKLSPDDGTNSATSISTPYPSGYPLPSTTPPPRGISVAKSFTFKESFVHEQPADTLVDYNNEKAPQHLPHVTPFRSPPPPVPPVEHGPAVTEAYIKRTLLLNAYPIMYILLWVPGIANRIAEASGHPSRVLVIMQASTQYVGLANAITYGLNEKVLGQLKAMVAKNSGERSVERCL